MDSRSPSHGPPSRILYKSKHLHKIMKKEGALLLIMLFFISFTSAKTFCSDNSKVFSDEGEIERGSSKVINDLGIGLTRTEERVFYRRIIADLLIDARKIDLSNQTLSETINILSGSYTVAFGNSTDTSAMISIDGESKNIEENEVETIKGLFVMVSNAESAEGGKARAIIGAKKISLSNDQNPAEKITFKNTTYLVELNSASQTNAIVSVSFCKTGEITYESEIKNNSVSNQTQETTNQTNTNITANKSITEDVASDDKQITVEEANRLLNKKLNNESGTNIESPAQKAEPGFFGRLWNWFKELFS